MKTPRSKLLYLPVETAARELDGKLLLAVHTASKGVTTIVGNRALLNANLHKFSPGIYLSHNFDKGRRRILTLLRQMGYHVIAWDEEGLVWVDEKTYRRRRVNAESIKQLSTIFAWGSDHRKALAPATDPINLNVLETGNPRADLLTTHFRPLYETRRKALEKEYGNFILINSNFGWLNYALAKAKGTEKTETELELLALKSNHPLGYLKHRYAIFSKIIELLPKLSKRFPDRNIIIRPHPSESPEGWKQATENLENVTVHYDGDLIPWLLAADTIIHNGCTTAIEAALLDRTTLMYRPIDGGEHEIRQPLDASIEVSNDNELFALIDDPEKRKKASAKAKLNLDQMVTGLGERLSVEAISENIANLQENELNRANLVEKILGNLKMFVRTTEKTFAKNSPTSPTNPAYVDKKFPPASEEEIAARVSRLAELSRLAVPKVRMLQDRIFEISPQA